MEFDQENLRPTYKLLIGVPGTSCGIEIARRLGLTARVVERAVQELSPEAREAGDLIAYLHRSRDELDALKRETREQIAQLEGERRSLQTEWIERQRKRIAELEKSFLEAQKRLEAEVARVAADVKERSLRAQVEKQSARRVAALTSDARAETDAAVLETLASSQADLGVTPQAEAKPIDVAQLSAGQRIRVRGFKQAVIFRRHDGRNAEIEAGPMRMKVPVAEILGVEENVAAGAGSSAANLSARPVTVRAAVGGAVDEINVIGCTVEEATERVDKFLDNAALAAKASVRIIHGHGTGALRRGLAEFLTGHPLVDAIHAEAEDRGGTAITVAELKS
jgi:DNA mismatch repair protein MutS2